jgi:hypothetical protein
VLTVPLVLRTAQAYSFLVVVALAGLVELLYLQVLVVMAVLLEVAGVAEVPVPMQFATQAKVGTVRLAGVM